MRIEFFKRSVLGTAIAVLCLTGVPTPINSPAQASPDAPPPPPDNSATAGGLPPNIFPTSPLAQVIRLSQAGVDESIILTFVNNSSGTFNLDSDKIIYLRDIGLPNGIITAMMQRDQQLQQQMAAANPPPVQPAPATDTNPQPETPPPPPEEQPAPPPPEITVNYFYDSLAPYGAWVNVDGYGRCWRPSVCVYNPSWQPYCDHGHWVYTDCGWYWYSDYSWGWAPFHYGRWFQHPHWGWCWTPDTVWAPSWVTWRYSSGYCGWAPLPPFATYQAGIGFFYRGSAVSIGFNWGLNESCFTFVPTQFFCDPHPRRYCVASAQVTQIFNQTTVINNFNVQGRTFVNRGIEPEHISAVTRTPIRPVAIRTMSAPTGPGPRGDQLSRDGGALIIARPPHTGSPAQNHPPQPIRQPQVPIITTHGPQNGNAVRVLPQPSSPPPTYNPTPAPAAPNQNYSPRGWEQAHPSQPQRPNPYNSGTPAAPPAPNPGQPGASEAERHSAPAVAPAQPHPQHNQTSSSPRSSGQNQNQTDSGNNSGGNSGNGPGNGSGYGPKH